MENQLEIIKSHLPGGYEKIPPTVRHPGQTGGAAP